MRVLWLAIVPAALAQQPAPHIGYVYPAGGRQGTTFQVTVGGQFLNGVAQVYVSGAGIQARVLEHVRPTPPAEINRLREQVRELAGKDPKAAAEAREKLMVALRRPANPAFGETVTLEVTVASGAATGERELRLGTAAGLTNPLLFKVGKVPEVAEKPDRVLLDPRAPRSARGRPQEPPVEIAPPVVVNGQIMPGGVDRYRFHAREGLRLAVAVEARKLIPYISDAVPGWFQAAVALYDASGKEVAYADDDRFNPDPVLAYTIPAEGEYTLEIRDAIYRGREDFVYRASIGEPPADKRRPKPVKDRIEKPGDTDVFRYKGRRGEELVAEVIARRLDSPLDSVLRIADAKGREIAFNDDHEDRANGLLTHHADSYIRTRLPANGTYTVQVSDAQGNGGPDYAYRLRLGRPQPDFELRVVPASVNVRAGASVPITVHALRRDGFAGEIALELKDSEGFALSGAWIPAGQDRVRLTLAAPPAPPEGPVKLTLEGRSGNLRRTAVPAEDMMQAFAYHHLVPAQEWMVQVTPARNRAPWKLVSEQPVRLPADGTTVVRIAARLGRYAEQVQYALNEPPEGIALEKIVPDRDGLDMILRVDKVKPGLKGNLIVDVLGGPRRTAVATLPAIRFEVVSSAPAP